NQRVQLRHDVVTDRGGGETVVFLDDLAQLGAVPGRWASGEDQVGERTQPEQILERGPTGVVGKLRGQVRCCGLVHVGGQDTPTQDGLQVFGHWTGTNIDFRGGIEAGDVSGVPATAQAQTFPGSHLPVGDVQVWV